MKIAAMPGRSIAGAQTFDAQDTPVGQTVYANHRQPNVVSVTVVPSCPQMLAMGMEG